jgi:hypothetical protein
MTKYLILFSSGLALYVKAVNRNQAWIKSLLLTGDDIMTDIVECE